MLVLRCRACFVQLQQDQVVALVCQSASLSSCYFFPRGGVTWASGAMESTSWTACAVVFFVLVGVG